jgi:RNA polymerase sigma-70 factor (sigma-E family)
MKAVTGMGAELPVADDAVPGRGAGEHARSSRDAAVAGLYAARYAGLVGLASLLVDNAEDAHDVVQEAFVGLYDRWERLHDADRAGAYLQVSVVNGCRTTLRRRLLARRHRVDGPGPVPDVAEDVVNRLRADVLAVALHRLPRRERECVVLRYYADLSEAQTAATLNVSVGAAKGYASRGLSKLAALLQETPR